MSMPPSKPLVQSDFLNSLFTTEDTKDTGELPRTEKLLVKVRSSSVIPVSSVVKRLFLHFGKLIRP